MLDRYSFPLYFPNENPLVVYTRGFSYFNYNNFLISGKISILRSSMPERNARVIP